MLATAVLAFCLVTVLVYLWEAMEARGLISFESAQAAEPVTTVFGSGRHRHSKGGFKGSSTLAAVGR